MAEKGQQTVGEYFGGGITDFDLLTDCELDTETRQWQEFEKGGGGLALLQICNEVIEEFAAAKFQYPDTLGMLMDYGMTRYVEAVGDYVPSCWFRIMKEHKGQGI